LSETFGDVPDFVPHDVTGIIALSLTYQFAFQRPSATGDLGAGDQHEDLKVGKTFQFITCASDPIFSLWGSDCGGP
jgi:hypothetical protein